jgi:ABC-type uncharacterized transport system substrate-binding protein
VSVASVAGAFPKGVVRAIKLAVLTSATYPENQLLLPVAESVAKRLGVAVETYTIAKPEELDGAIATGKAAGAETIMTLQGPFFFFQRKLIADLALKHQLPLAMSEALAGDAGALLQVNPDVPGCAARSATYVDRILKGAKPGDLAVERYGNKQLVINLKTAKTLGMNVTFPLCKARKSLNSADGPLPGDCSMIMPSNLRSTANIQRPRESAVGHNAKYSEQIFSALPPTTDILGRRSHSLS